MVQFHIIAVSAQYFHLTGRFRFCLRQERGYCTTRWSVNTADANPFSVSMVVFTCGKRATGYGVNPVVVVGVVVVGGEPMYDLEKFMVESHFFLLFFFISPCMVCMLMYGLEGEGGLHPILKS